MITVKKQIWYSSGDSKNIYTPNEEYQNFVLVPIEAAASKSQTVPWEAVKKKWDNMKKSVLI